MKKILTLAYAVVLFVPAFATIRTVSNDPNNPAQFATVQAAVNTSVAGDTVYINLSPTVYNENVSVNKRLVIIGGGYNSPNQLGYTSTVNNIFFTRAGGDPSGSIVCGLNLLSISVNGGLPTISNITVFRNRINGFGLVGNNWLIYNNIINGTISLGNNPVPNNVIIQNNILQAGINGNTGNNNFLIDHNLFLGNPNSFLNNVQLATITNNIFAVSSNSAFINSNTINNNFNNNITNITNVSVNAPTNSFSGGPNAASGNIVGTDPAFVNAPVASFNLYNASNNYRLSATSQAKNAGTDGTDLGIYGGSYPFPSGGAAGSGFDTCPLPPIPQVNSVNIQNGTLTPGAQLKVTIQATVNN